MSDARAECWDDAAMAAALFAVDPVGMGGIAVRASAGPVRDRWLALLRALLPETPFKRLPLHIDDNRLLGGLDLAASLQAGRPVADTGFLAAADGGIVLLPMAERLSPGAAARLVAVMDAGETCLERDGMAKRLPARFGMVVFDEGLAEDEMPPAALLDRLALRIDLRPVAWRAAGSFAFDAAAIQAARERIGSVEASSEMIAAICEAAAALGIASLRAPLLALRASRLAAALAGDDAVDDDSAALAVRLVLLPRALILPEMQAAEEPSPADPDPERSDADAPPDDPTADDPTAEIPAADDAEPVHESGSGELILQAALAAVPPGLLARLGADAASRSRAQAAGRSGRPAQASRRGRPAGVRRGRPGDGSRLNLVETLRAAAPWQVLRALETAGTQAGSGRIAVRREDFRVNRLKQRTETLTIFVVDASGSSAYQRLAEAKGAVELLLADCYVRRDSVALVAFRGKGADLLLPPTRSLVRAKRNLAALPGGGPTPLAAGIDAAFALAESVRRNGRSPAIVLMTDGRANMTRDGVADRSRAQAEALAAAREVMAGGMRAIVVDTGPRPRPEAESLAAAMGALYVPLPSADSGALSAAVRPHAGSGARPARSGDDGPRFSDRA